MKAIFEGPWFCPDAYVIKPNGRTPVDVPDRFFKPDEEPNYGLPSSAEIVEAPEGYVLDEDGSWVRDGSVPEADEDADEAPKLPSLSGKPAPGSPGGVDTFSAMTKAAGAEDPVAKARAVAEAAEKAAAKKPAARKK